MQFLQEPPEIGKNYIVPCIKGYRNGKGILTPIVNEFAIDDDFLNADLTPHAHIDRRFCNAEVIEHHSPKRVEDPLNLVMFNHEGYSLDKLNEGIEYEEFKCVNSQNYITNHGKSTHLEKVNQHKTMTCRKCPHQGTDLSSFLPDEEGNLVCPAHGLAWNQNSGKLVPRKTLQEKMARNYLKHYELPKIFNVSTYTNNLYYTLNPETKLSEFDINSTIETTKIVIKLDPFVFRTEELLFAYKDSPNIFGYVIWKNNFPILAVCFEYPAKSAASLAIKYNYDYGKDI